MNDWLYFRHDVDLGRARRPNRRAVLELLLQRPRAVRELVERLGLTQPGTSKHLRVLREAGLVRCAPRPSGACTRSTPGPLAELDDWLAPYRRLWNEQPRRARTAPRQHRTEED